MRTFTHKQKQSQQINSFNFARSNRSFVGQSRELGSTRHMQCTSGNQSVQRSLNNTSPDFNHDFSQIPVHANAYANTQPKLRVNAPGDKYEKEADRVADQVMQLPASQPLRDYPCSGGYPEYRSKQNDHGKLQAKSASSHESGRAAPQSAQGLISSTGRPLEPHALKFMESRFGQDFSRVRIHTDNEASRTATQIHAHAYTTGRDIYFGESKYQPNMAHGRKLIAHELTHTIQNGSVGHTQDQIENAFQGTSINVAERVGAGPHILPFRDPDVVHNGHYSFYVNAMFQRPGTQVRIQFHQDSSRSDSVTLALWYEETGTMESATFSTNGPVSPVLIDEAFGVATIDIDGDGLPDVVIQAFPVRQSGGLLFQVHANGQHVLAMHARPRAVPLQLPPRVPTGARLAGTLPNGLDYYVLPYTSNHPAGPFYVDAEGHGVNPALEFRAGAVLEGAEQGLLIGAGALLVIGTAGIALETGAAAAAGPSILRFLFSGRSLVAGGTSAGANLITQASEYGTEWDQYNWPSAGFDYVLGVASYRLVAALFARWPARIFSAAARNLTTWSNFSKQQAVFALYGTAVGLLRAQVSNTSRGSTVAAQHTSGAVQAVKSGAMQTFLLSPYGRANFPQGMHDPRIIFLNRMLSLILNVAVREVFDVVPGKREQSDKGVQEEQK